MPEGPLGEGTHPVLATGPQTVAATPGTDLTSVSQPAGVNTLLTAMGNAQQINGACRWCSGPFSAVIHSGACPRVKAIEYHENGMVKRVEFHEDGER